MVIVEGPDGGGKTTLVDRLSRALGVEVHERACTSSDGPVPELCRWVERDLSGPSGGLYDRHPLISETIYGPIIRGHMVEDFGSRRWLRDAMVQFRRKDPFIIFCLPAWETVSSNILKTHEPTTSHLRGVLMHGQALYESYVLRWSLEPDAWLWDYTAPDSDRDLASLTLLCKEAV